MNILKRANYALENEKEELPAVVLEEKTEERLQFIFVWSKGKQIRLFKHPEYYYKKEQKLSGAIWLQEQMKNLLKQVNKTIKEIGEEKLEFLSIVVFSVFICFRFLFLFLLFAYSVCFLLIDSSVFCSVFFYFLLVCTYRNYLGKTVILVCFLPILCMFYICLYLFLILR